MSVEDSFDALRTLINVSVSNMVSGSELANVANIFFSISEIYVLRLAKFIASCCLYISTSGFSCMTTSTNICSSSPSNVTVKFIIVNFIHTSGK